MTIELDTSSNLTGDAKIKVVCIGGGGGIQSNIMINKGLSGVDFFAANSIASFEHNKLN
jgi:cell division GTPase FtsZ